MLPLPCRAYGAVLPDSVYCHAGLSATVMPGLTRYLGDSYFWILNRVQDDSESVQDDSESVGATLFVMPGLTRYLGDSYFWILDRVQDDSESVQDDSESVGPPSLSCRT